MLRWCHICQETDTCSVSPCHPKQVRNVFLEPWVVLCCRCHNPTAKPWGAVLQLGYWVCQELHLVSVLPAMGTSTILRCAIWVTKLQGCSMVWIRIRTLSFVWTQSKYQDSSHLWGGLSQYSPGLERILACKGIIHRAIKCRCLGFPNPTQSLNTVGMGWNLRICILNDLRSTVMLWVHRLHFQYCSWSV